MPDTDLKREWEQDVELKPAVTGSKFVGKNGSGSGNRQLCRYWRLLDPEKGKVK